MLLMHYSVTADQRRSVNTRTHQHVFSLPVFHVCVVNVLPQPARGGCSNVNRKCVQSAGLAYCWTAACSRESVLMCDCGLASLWAR